MTLRGKTMNSTTATNKLSSENILNKIGVLNIFQVLFQIHLLKPSLWSNYATEDIVKSIKNMSQKEF